MHYGIIINIVSFSLVISLVNQPGNSQSLQAEGQNVGHDHDLVLLNKHTLNNRRRSSRLPPVCCRSNSQKSCNRATVNPALLGKPSLNLPGGITVAFSNIIPGNNNAYYYTSSNANVYITYSPSSGGMHGNAKVNGGPSFTLENCGAEGHVWAEIDPDKIQYDDLDDSFDTSDEEIEEIGADYDMGDDDDALIELGRTDNITVATYSIKVYFTNEFAEMTPDIPGFIDQAIAYTNQGYKNSGVPLIATLHCIEAATLHDKPKSKKMHDKFKKMKSSRKELRGGADVTTLFMGEGKCGKGFNNGLHNGKATSVLSKRCAINKLGHEIGHNIGLSHDMATSENEKYPYGHGHHISHGSDRSGIIYQTIMAYRPKDGQKSEEINYYSSPDVIFPKTATPTGMAGVSNNRRILMENRFLLEYVDDESTPCPPLELPENRRKNRKF